mmetsp:Transcript_93109/g.301018  ORF Transcript_93109/g.301018 Transcript_93109/m.301018 type:complete len:243 (-) Transcript_93109:295-1023(-)
MGQRRLRRECPGRRPWPRRSFGGLRRGPGCRRLPLRHRADVRQRLRRGCPRKMLGERPLCLDRYEVLSSREGSGYGCCDDRDGPAVHLKIETCGWLPRSFPAAPRRRAAALLGGAGRRPRRRRPRGPRPGRRRLQLLRGGAAAHPSAPLGSPRPGAEHMPGGAELGPTAAMFERPRRRLSLAGCCGACILALGNGPALWEVRPPRRHRPALGPRRLPHAAFRHGSGRGAAGAGAVAGGLERG